MTHLSSHKLFKLNFQLPAIYVSIRLIEQEGKKVNRRTYDEQNFHSDICKNHLLLNQ